MEEQGGLVGGGDAQLVRGADVAELFARLGVEANCACEIGMRCCSGRDDMPRTKLSTKRRRSGPRRGAGVLPAVPRAEPAGSCSSLRGGRSAETSASPSARCTTTVSGDGVSLRCVADS